MVAGSAHCRDVNVMCGESGAKEQFESTKSSSVCGISRELAAAMHIKRMRAIVKMESGACGAQELLQQQQQVAAGLQEVQCRRFEEGAGWSWSWRCCS
jgi:hypothetical protein